MFIELTDHLRCPADHDEAYLVLVPVEMRGRAVIEGLLGCPVCRREVPIHAGVPDFSGAPPPPPPVALPPGAVPALLGIQGPGGFLVLIGGTGALATDLAQQLPGVRLVLVNPPEGVVPGLEASVVRAGRLPVKAASMRGVVIDTEHAARAEWLDAASRCVLPGLRILVQGAAPIEPIPGMELLAEAKGWWVGARGREAR